MSIQTPKDRFNRPAVLGNCGGDAVPIKVREDGSVCVSVPDINGSVCASGRCRYEIVETLRLDLSVGRMKERYDIAFDSFAVTSIEGSFSLYMGSEDEKKRCVLDKCLSVDVSSETVFISNEPQQGFAELWFFKLEEDDA